MLEIFGSAKALLSPEFVEKVNPEALAAKLIKVEQEYDVKFEKMHSTFNITGHWHAVRAAHQSLLQLRKDLKINLSPKLNSEDDTVYISESKLQADSTSKEQIVVVDRNHKNHSQIEYDKLSRKNKANIVAKRHELKGNPRRGRHLADSNNSSIVPDPLVMVHFQDQSFPDESCVDMEQVLDEFEKGQVSKGVKKEDLKKIFEKNLEKIGRPPKKDQGLIIKAEADNREKVDKTINQMVVSEANECQVAFKSINNVQIATEEALHCCQRQTQTCDKLRPSQSIIDKPSGQPAIGNTSTSSFNVQELNDIQQAGYLKTISRKQPDDTGLKEVQECVSKCQTSSEITIQAGETNMTAKNAELSEKNKLLDVMEQDQPYPTDQLYEPSLKDDSSEKEIDVKEFCSAVETGVCNSRMCILGIAQPTNRQQNLDWSKLKEEKSRNALPQDKRLRSIQKGKANPKKMKLQSSKPPKEINKTTKYAKKVSVSESRKMDQKEEKGEVNQDQELADCFEDRVTKTKDKDGREIDTPIVYKCDFCDYQGNDKRRLKEHMARLHGLLIKNCDASKDKTLFICDQCDKTFVFGRDLKRHQKRVHNERRFQCDKCDKVYKSKYVLDRHMQKHAEGYVQPMFKCQLCNREFTTKFSLGTHTKSEHLGVQKTYMCPTCGKSFKRIRSYREHANVHAGIRPYVCEICGKSFSYDKSLKEHRYMHDEVKRFPCTICDKAFRQRTCLLIHMKTHRNSRDHICSSCGKGFSQRQSLIRHERCHSGHKPYTCKLCSKSFSDYAVVRKHLLLSHKQNKNDWKLHVITEERELSDHYIAGGPGYVKRDSCEKIQGKLDEKNKVLSSTRPAVHEQVKGNVEDRKGNKKMSKEYGKSTTEVPTKQSSDAIVNQQMIFHSYPKMRIGEEQYSVDSQQYTLSNEEGSLFIQHGNLNTLQSSKDARYVLSNTNQMHFVDSNYVAHSNAQIQKALSSVYSSDTSKNIVMPSISHSDNNQDVSSLNQSMDGVSGYQPILQYIGSSASTVNQLPHMEFWTRSYTKQK